MSQNTLAENLIRLQEAKEDIADAIVEMGGTASSTDGLEDMPDAIRTIEANPTLITKSITANGIYDAEDDDADGYSEVTVAVPDPTSITKAGIVTYDSGVSYSSAGWAKSYGKTIIVEFSASTSVYSLSSNRTLYIATVSGLTIPDDNDIKYMLFCYRYRTSSSATTGTLTMSGSEASFLKNDFTYGSQAGFSVQVVRYNSTTLKIGLVITGGGSSSVGFGNSSSAALSRLIIIS